MSRGVEKLPQKQEKRFEDAISQVFDKTGEFIIKEGMKIPEKYRAPVEDAVWKAFDNMGEAISKGFMGAEKGIRELLKRSKGDSKEVKRGWHIGDILKGWRKEGKEKGEKETTEEVVSEESENLDRPTFERHPESVSDETRRRMKERKEGAEPAKVRVIEEESSETSEKEEDLDVPSFMRHPMFRRGRERSTEKKEKSETTRKETEKTLKEEKGKIKYEDFKKLSLEEKGKMLESLPEEEGKKILIEEELEYVKKEIEAIKKLDLVDFLGTNERVQERIRAKKQTLENEIDQSEKMFGTGKFREEFKKAFDEESPQTEKSEQIFPIESAVPNEELDRRARNLVENLGKGGNKILSGYSELLRVYLRVKGLDKDEVNKMTSDEMIERAKEFLGIKEELEKEKEKSRKYGRRRKKESVK